MSGVTPGAVEIYNLHTGDKVEREHITVQWSIDAAEKGGYEYFMHKELHEVPQKVREQARVPQDDIEAFARTVMEAEHVYITAAGTAFYACLAGKFQITKFGGKYIEAILCSEFRDALEDAIPPNSVVIAVSQSGETADTVEAIRYAREKFGDDSDFAKRDYKKGDMNTSLIKTLNGKTIMLQHDVTSPRPYSRLHTVSGTKGFAQKYPRKGIALEPDAHRFLPEDKLDSLLKLFKHPIVSDIEEKAREVEQSRCLTV